jgi:hypothetical protein
MILPLSGNTNERQSSEFLHPPIMRLNTLDCLTMILLMTPADEKKSGSWPRFRYGFAHIPNQDNIKIVVDVETAQYPETSRQHSSYHPFDESY